VRIVGGRHRGRRLVAPPGDAVRTTSDRAREALFNILAHGRFAAGSGPVWQDRVVLDAFAGTGALGLEALSRGAAESYFIERERAALDALRRNIDALGETARAHLRAGDALHPPPAPRPAELAFLDPPYREGLAAPALAALAASGWLATGAVVVVEVGAKEAFVPPDGFEPLDERRYGAARLVFLRRDERLHGHPRVPPAGERG
jgi:16S rRNA (guanine966-N2)-methyltransferase